MTIRRKKSATLGKGYPEWLDSKRKLAVVLGVDSEALLLSFGEIFSDDETTETRGFAKENKLQEAPPLSGKRITLCRGSDFICKTVEPLELRVHLSETILILIPSRSIVLFEALMPP